MMNQPIGVRWQPNAMQTLNTDDSAQPPQAVSGGPATVQVKALNIPSRPAPNQPVPQSLLLSRGGMDFGAFLNLMSQLSLNRGTTTQASQEAGMVMPNPTLRPKIGSGGALGPPRITINEETGEGLASGVLGGDAPQPLPMPPVSSYATRLGDKYAGMYSPERIDPIF